MTEILDIISNIVLLPYHITKAILMFLLANLIIVIVLISIIIVTLIVLAAIFPGFFIKVLFGVVSFTLGLILAGLSLASLAIPVVGIPLSIIGMIILIIAFVAGPLLYVIKKFTWQRILVALTVGTFAGTFLLGWVIGEFIEDAIRKPEFEEFAKQIEGTLTAYDGKGNSERHRAAIAIKPGSKYYGLALTMTEKDDIDKTDSGKFWVTQEIPNVVYLFKPAYDNLNISPFYQ